MLTYFTKILFILSPVIFLSSCSTPTPDDEKYGFIEGNFPLLAEVPNRPWVPHQKEIDNKINSLEKDKDQAQTQATDSFKLAKK